MGVRLIEFLSYLIDLYVWVVIASVILSWLLTFGVVNYSNPFVRSLTQALHAVTEPALKVFRRLTPNLGAIDISPVLLLLALFFVQSVILGSLHDALR
jgi:YggT family protein